MDFVSDDENNNRYTRSAAYLEKWIEDQQLIFEDKPAFYIYEQVFSLDTDKSSHSDRPSHSLKGIIGLVQLEDFCKKIVLPHETISKAKEDRLNLMRTTKSNLSQVYSLYIDENKEIAGLLETYSDGKPDITFVTDDNITQNIWIIKDAEVNSTLSAMFAEKQLFIADGHHRYETALNYRNERREADETAEGTMPYDYIMMMLVSMSDGGLFVFPTHRMVRGIENFDEVLLVGFLTEEFTVSKIFFTEGDYADIIQDRLSNTVDETLFGLYTGQNYYYLLKLKSTKNIDSIITDKTDAYKHLDVTILHKLILEKYLGMDCAFLINPPKVSEIKQIAEDNEKMPQKSTYFWPKLVTGIVINKFDI